MVEAWGGDYAVVEVKGVAEKMEAEEALANAMVVAVMIALPVLIAPFRALLGFRSDTHKSSIGWKRVPYIWFGSLWQFGGLAIMPFALLVLGGDVYHEVPFAGEILAALAFLMTGLGLHMTQTAGLALASDRLQGQLQRFRELAVFLADHPLSHELATGRGAGEARALFLVVADKTDALDVMFVDRAGQVQAAARGPAGGDLSATAYVRRALQGALGWGHAVARPLDRRAFYRAAPSFGADGKVQGAVVVAAGMDGIEDAWRGGLRAVFFTDIYGQVFVTNRSELVLWQRAAQAPGLAPPEGDAPPFGSYGAGGHGIGQLGWGRYRPQNALHLVKHLPVIGLTGEVLVDVAPARQLAKLQATVVAALCLAFGALLFLATERRRVPADREALDDAQTRVQRLATTTDVLLGVGALAGLTAIGLGVAAWRPGKQDRSGNVRAGVGRSEERRVGTECRSRWAP